MSAKDRICILGYDALEIELVEKFDLSNLKQAEYGRTDISEFDIISTLILWGSFITGRNMTPEYKVERSNSFKNFFRGAFQFVKSISPEFAESLRNFPEKVNLLKGMKQETFDWNYMIEADEKTIFDLVEDSAGINIPSYNQQWCPKFSLKEKIEEDVTDSVYLEDVRKCFEKTKNELLENLDKDLVMAWFAYADKIGHVWRTDMERMREAYSHLDDFAEEVREKFDGQIFIIADHGMKPLGRFGDHSDLNYGYYSSNRKLGLSNPQLTYFYRIVRDILFGEFNPEKYPKGHIEEAKEEKFEGDEKKEIEKRLKELGYF